MSYDFLTIKPRRMEKPHEEVYSMLQNLQTRLDVLERNRTIESNFSNRDRTRDHSDRTFSLGELAYTAVPGKKKLANIYWNPTERHYDIYYLAKKGDINLTHETRRNASDLGGFVSGTLAAAYNSYSRQL